MQKIRAGILSHTNISALAGNNNNFSYHIPFVNYELLTGTERRKGKENMS